MRLHRLEVCGIGPFAKRQLIEFEPLNQAGLFLLSGPTGSGKTSVLDAVAIALYGQPPGARSGGQDIVSHHRDLDVRPEVQLEATIGERRIRITRSPEHRRPRKRGSGETTERATAMLEVADADGGWTAYSSRNDEVNATLREWLGMDRDQFNQVVMLPQGQFATFLRADANERRKLLEQLFPSFDFTYVENWLRDHARQAMEARAAKKAEIDQCLAAAIAVASPGGQEAGAESDEESERSGEDQPEGLIEPDRIGDVGEVEAWVEETDAKLSADLERAEEEQRAAKDRLDEAARKFGAAEARQQKIASCEQQREVALADWRRVRSELSTVPGFGADESLPESPQEGSVDQCRERERGLRRQVTELAAFERDQIARRNQLTREISELEQQREALTTEADELERAAEVAPDRAKELERELREAESAQARQGEVSDKVKDAAKRLRAARDRDQLITQIKAAEQAETDLRRQVEDQHRRWVELRQARQAGLAAELAAELKEAVPCPVCGALEHPSPAEPAEDTPSKEEEEAAERLLEDLRAEHGRQRDRLEGLRGEQNRLDGEAGGGKTEALEEAHRKAEAELATLTAKANSLESARHRLAEHEEKQKRAAKRQSEIEATLARIDVQVESKCGAIDEIDEREDALREDDPSVPDRRRRLERAADLFGQAAEAAIRAAEAEKLRREAEAIKLELELGPAEQARNEAADAHEEATSNFATARSRLASFRREAGRLPRLLGEHKPLSEAADVAVELANLAQGRNPARMHLATYVLAARLEQVIEAANQRLGPMSSGRYRLVYWSGLARRGAASGLGIRVFDAYTGTERDTGSLSGGESFYASLALALGLAEVVQHETGGRRLETLFIDEGFGTLDSDTLDQVMSVLDELRAGGRTVGVVSHVEELKTRIPSRIEVDPTPAGSKLAVVGA